MRLGLVDMEGLVEIISQISELLSVSDPPGGKHDAIECENCAAARGVSLDSDRSGGKSNEMERLLAPLASVSELSAGIGSVPHITMNQIKSFNAKMIIKKKWKPLLYCMRKKCHESYLKQHLHLVVHPLNSKP